MKQVSIIKNFFKKIATTEIAEGFFEEFEEILIEADVGVKTTGMILDHLKKQKINLKSFQSIDVKNILKAYIKELITEGRLIDSPGLKIILFTGINGVGKTTSLVKLAYYLLQNGSNVKIVAGDTFRAAASEQLQVWTDRIRVPLLKTTPGSDSGAVVFDGITSALSDRTDYLIIDTAGRMHTKEDLMRELQKIRNICMKRIQQDHIENILVVDSTTGQNSYTQAEIFNEYIPLTGVFLSKYDSIFKGGIVIRISSELEIPIKFIGTGESLSDFGFFNKNDFIESLI